jgi:hypothetical protein
MFIQVPASKASIARRRLVQKVGTNDAPYQTTFTDDYGKHYTCTIYRTWLSLVARCYSKAVRKKQPTYRECTMDSSWLLFSNFYAWMRLQDWKNKAIDKDIIVPGNKHYSPETCVFVTLALNNLLTSRDNHRGKYPLGVSSVKINNILYYVASCSFYGKQKRLGYFKSIPLAEQAYKKAKSAHIKEIAKNTQDPRIKQALLRHLLV